MKHLLFKSLIISFILSFFIISSGICGTYIYYDEDGNPIVLSSDNDTPSKDSAKDKEKVVEPKIIPLNTGSDSIKTR